MKGYRTLAAAAALAMGMTLIGTAASADSFDRDREEGLRAMFRLSIPFGSGTASRPDLTPRMSFRTDAVLPEGVRMDLTEMRFEGLKLEGLYLTGTKVLDGDLRLHQAEGAGPLGLGWGTVIIGGAVVVIGGAIIINEVAEAENNPAGGDNTDGDD